MKELDLQAKIKKSIKKSIGTFWTSQKKLGSGGQPSLWPGTPQMPKPPLGPLVKYLTQVPT